MPTPRRQGAGAAAARRLLAVGIGCALGACDFSGAFVVFEEYPFAGLGVCPADAVAGLQTAQVGLCRFTVLPAVGCFLGFFLRFFGRLLLFRLPFAELGIALSQCFLLIRGRSRRCVADARVFRFGAGRATRRKLDTAAGADTFHDLGVGREGKDCQCQGDNSDSHIRHLLGCGQ